MKKNVFLLLISFCFIAFLNSNGVRAEKSLSIHDSITIKHGMYAAKSNDSVEVPPEELDRLKKAKAKRDRAKMLKEKNKQADEKPGDIIVPSPVPGKVTPDKDFGPPPKEIKDLRAGIYDIITIPAGAEVFMKGKSLGYAPVTIADFGGSYPLKISLPGYEEVFLGIIIKPGRMRSITVILEND